jgi:hypothetical protein
LELTKDTKVVTDVSPLSFDGSRHFSLIHLIDTVRYIHPPSARPASIVHSFTISFVRRTMPKNRTIKQTVEQENAIAEEAKAVVLSSVVLIWQEAA